MANQASLIDALEQVRESEEAKRLLAPHRGEAGVSKAYFDRIASYFVGDPSKAYGLARHWRVVASLGDDPSYAYRAKGVGDRSRGDWLASAKAFQRAGELAADPAEKLSFQAGAVDALARAKRMDEAESLAAFLVSGLRKLGRRDLAARVLLNLGNALLLQDRMAEARKHLEEALAGFEESGLEAEAVSALLGLSTSHLYCGHPRKAAELAETTRARAQAAGLDFADSMAKMNLAHAMLLTGRPDDALDRFLEVRDDLAVAPTEQTRSIEFAGDAYYRLNLWPEALDAYREAMGRTDSIQASHEANVRLGIGLCLIALDRPSEAISFLTAAQKRYTSLKNTAWASACVLAKSHAYRALGRKAHARHAAEQAKAMARTSGSAYHWCEAVLHQEADTADIARAGRLIQAHGFVGMAWRAHRLQAQRELGATRLKHYRRMADSMVQSRLLTTSLISRASFLRDKSEALRDYLAELLENPNRAKVREALRLILETRSVTLLDEILAARTSELSPAVVEQLQQAREELQALAAEESSPTGSRRSAGIAEVPEGAQRRWVEAARNARAVLDRLPAANPDRIAILAQASDRLYAITGDSVARLACTTSDLERSLRWLEYELMAPMVDPEACPRTALKALATLSNQLARPWSSADVDAVCPDGLLWRVPWQCLGGDGCPPDLALHPGVASPDLWLGGKESKALLWISEAADLPYAKADAEAFRRKFPQATVCRTASAALESLAGAYDVIHVVAHAHHRAENPMFSSIEFSDGPVFATDIARSRLQAKLVTLAACDTGAMSLVSKEEPDGLARAFLARGASSVVASAWALHDEAAARAFRTFYESLSEGRPVREALHEARCRLREWREHPYYWGALALYRGYAL